MIKRTILELLFKISPEYYLSYIFRKNNMADLSSLEELKLKAEPFLLKYLLKPEQKFFDVGCHNGEYLYMSRGVVPEENLYGFEPNPESYKRLKQVFKNCNIHNMALSDRDDTLEFKVPLIRGKQMETRGTLEIGFKEDNESGQITYMVKTQTIDSFVAEHAIQNIGLIKIDVEGHEVKVIKGAAQTIANFRPVLIAELEQRHLHDNLDAVINNIKGEEYRCFYFDMDSGVVELQGSAADVQLEKYHKVNPVRYVNNFIFIHHSSEVIANLLAANENIGVDR